MQIVEPMFACVTRGSVAPGVQTGSGSGPRAVHKFVLAGALVAAADGAVVGLVVGDVAVAATVGSSVGAVEDRAVVVSARAPEVATA